METYQLITRSSCTFFVVNGINIEIHADVAGKSWQNLTWTRTKTELETLRRNNASRDNLGVCGLCPALGRLRANLRPHWLQEISPSTPSGTAGYLRVLTNLHDVQTAENDAETEGCDLIAIARIYLWKKTTPFTSGELAAKFLAEGRSRKEGCSSPGHRHPQLRNRRQTYPAGGLLMAA